MAEARKLVKMEVLAILGIQSREREVERDVIGPLRADFQDILSEVALRLGLPEGSIGRDYQLDMKTWELVEVPAIPVEEAVSGKDETLVGLQVHRG